MSDIIYTIMAPLLTPNNALQVAQAQSVAQSAPATATPSSGTTTNAQTGQVFQNATTGPYTLANANQASTTTPTAQVQAVTPTAQATTPAMAPSIVPMPTTKKTTSIPVNPIVTPASTKQATDQNAIIEEANKAQLKANQAKRQSMNIAPQDNYTKATPDQKSQADNMLKIIDPTGGMSGADQQSIRNAFLSNDTQAISELQARYQNNLNSEKNFSDATKILRDAKMQDEYQNNEYTRSLAQKEQEFTEAITRQQQTVNNTINNMAVTQDVA
jgi:hypothetical protein